MALAISRLKHTLWQGGLFLLFSGGILLHAAPTVRYLAPSDYFPTVLTEIQKARHSIHVALYLLSLYPNRPQSLPQQLAQALVDAQARGVQVEVLLEKTPTADWQAPESLGKNHFAYQFFRRNNVPVFFAGGPPLHSKMIIVDDRVVIVGSTNWSDNAMNENNESNFWVNDSAVAQQALAHLQQISRENDLPERDTSAFIPADFVVSPDGLGAMARAGDERAFDTYLYILRQSSPTLSFTALADHLALSPMGPVAYRRQITKVLRKLETKYKLLKVDFEFGKDPHLTLLPSRSSETVTFPEGYWSWRWDQRLHFPAKVAFLLSTYYSDRSPDRPRWSWSVNTLAQRHRFSPAFFRNGTTELRRAQLLTVTYDTLTFDAAPRTPNIYTPRPLYDPAELDHQLQTIEKQDNALFSRARRAAHMVYADSDVALIQTLIHHERQFGRSVLDRAFAILGAKNPDNPKRSPGYLLKTVESLAREASTLTSPPNHLPNSPSSDRR